MGALPAHLSSFIFALSSFFLIFVSQKQFTATTMHLKSDTLLKRGEYRIIETLGRGGFGITYLAEQVNLHRKVCIKEFFPKDYFKRDEDSVSISLLSESFKENMSRFKAKFVKEAQTIATLNHANIIPIHDVFEENGTAYYVMDYIEGESLSERVKRGGAMSERDAVAYIRQVASALGYIHARQIMHLDVKPGNIMVREEDRRAILIDFGLSKHYDATSGEATSTTPVGVSHGYAPMEQYQDGGVSTFSPETDIYSLGATLYFLVTGNVPPQTTVVAEQGLPNIEGLSSNIRKAIEISMSYWRKDRPHTIKEFLAMLDGDEAIVMVLADESEKTKIVTPQPKPQPRVEQPQPKTPIEPAPKPKRSRGWVWLLGLLLIGGGVRFIFGDNNTESEALPEENVESEVLPETSTPYQVGDLYNENGKQGVVFEVTADGRHGKIVSLDEAQLAWDSRVEWSDSEQDFINGTEIGANDMSDGKANTDMIMQRGDSDQYPAFVWCRDKGEDWYLPAKDELEAIYNTSAINSTLAEYGAQHTVGWYWSSTEYEDEPEFCAWLVHMYDGSTYNLGKYGSLYVRAVSAF
ncbi:MAG: DUF1566 domain-containing protein [Rikenellaceae bacterium]|nr:DUF1566 domain-containing protein [Rikenellaceae bacterium]